MHLSGIPMDAQGLQMNALAALAQREHRRGSTILYTIPTNQNPTGITMSLPRREAVLRFGAENRLPIIEDGAYEELCFSPAPPSLKALDRAGTVLYLAARPSRSHRGFASAGSLRASPSCSASAM